MEEEIQTTFEEQSIEDFEDLSGGDVDETTDIITIEE
jgi:hypothetical protein